MSGHSHWAGIKHKKGLQDAKRAKIFTKLAKPIVIAARDGGGSPAANFRLRLAIDKAREFNMPKDNIDRAIKRGTGELKGMELQELLYEAMGPDGIMMLIKVTTDNKNRTVSEIKAILNKLGGKMGETGSAMWNFEQVGSILVDPSGKDPEELEIIAIDCGAKDILSSKGSLAVFTDIKDIQRVQENLEKAGIEVLEAGLIYLPQNTVSLDENTRIDYEKLLEALDDQDDTDEIYDNVA